MSNLFNDLANGKYKLKGTNTVNNTNQSQNSKGNLFNDLANGKYKLKETAPTSAVSAQNSAVSAQNSAVNKSEKPIFDTTKVQNRIAELDNLMKETDLKIRQHAKYTPEQRSEFQKQYGTYKDEYWKLRNELEAQTTKPSTGELPKSEYYKEDAQMLSKSEYDKLNKQAPLTQKIDKAIKNDIPKTVEKVGRTAADLVGSGLVGATNAVEGMVDFAVGNVGALASGVTSGFGLAPNSLSEKIKKGAEDFTRFNFSAEEILEEKKNEGTGIYEPKILGFKVRDAVNTISNMIAAAAVGGVPGFITSAAGQGIEEALLDNQSLNRAVVYGDISGAIEGLTEKMFDAVKLLGGGKFDKFLPKGAIGKFIGGSVGEGIEEVIADGINPFLKYLTYEKGTYDMPTLAEYLNMLKESAWNGFVIGLIMKGGQDISSPQIREQYKQEVYTAVDKSKLPDNVKGVVKEVMITPAQQQINQDIQNYKNTSDYSKYISQNNQQNDILKLQKENDANNVKNDVPNASQIQNMQQPNVTLPTQAEMAQKANIDQIRGNTKLVTQRAETTLQSAKIAGASDINMNKAIELNDLLRSGAEVKFYNPQNIPQGVDSNRAKVANGFYSNGTVWINKNTKNAVEVVLGHELTHHLETTDSYTDLANTILDSDVFYDYIAEKGYSNVAEYKQSLGQNYTAEQFDSEMVANFVQDKLFSDQNSIDRLARQNTNLVEKIKNWISDLVVSFKGTAQEKELRRIEGMYRKALEQARNSTATSTDTQYSVGGVIGARNIQNNPEYRNIMTDYREANQLLNNGATNRETIRKTGWFKDTDGNVKYEFTDEDMALKDSYKFENNKVYPLDKILKHDILFEAYPQLRDYTVVSMDLGETHRAAIFGPMKVILLNNQLLKTKGQVEYSLIHEIQHAIQNIEGFPGARTNINGKYAYYTSLGEIESRDTSNRLRMLAEERRINIPETAKENPTHPSLENYLKNRKETDIEKDNKYIAKKERTEALKESVKKFMEGRIGFDDFEENNNSNIYKTTSEDDKLSSRIDGGRRLADAGKEPAFSMPETANPDIRYSMNPVEIAKNPPNPRTGLDSLNKSKRVKEGDSQSSFADNLLNQNIFDERFTDLALDDKNISSYESISNKETLQKANDAINEQGQKWVDRFKDKSAGEMKAEDIAGGFILMSRYQQVGDYESMLRIAEKLREAGTKQGQTIQLFSVMGRMTPEGMTYYAQKELSKAYDEILKNKTQAWADEHAGEFKLNERDIDFIQRRVNQASKLPEGRDKYILLAEISERIQNKIPPQAGQSLKALARNSMLLNPKTMVRNILGNIVIVPNHIISDFVGTGLDKAISKTTGVRTTGFINGGTIQGMKKGAYESFDDFRRKITTRDMSGDRFELGKGGKNFYEKHTGRFANTRNAINKALNGLDRVTGFLLETGDRPFYEAWFINSLNNQMKLNNATEPTAEMIEIATDEALQRTWQDNNTYTNAVRDVRDGFNKFNIKGYGLGDIVMPFVKTPANLTKAVVDFSPLGAINAALKTSQFRKDIGKGVATSKQQREVVKAWSQVITGTLGMAVMTALANAGILIGGSDEDKDVRNFEEKVLGIKPYSIKIGDKSYTYDWAQPLGTSAAIVADTTRSLKNANDTESKVAAVLQGLQSGASVLLDQSFVSSIRQFFEEDGLISALLELTFNEPSKFTPQFLSQLAQIQDDTARVSYVYDDIPKTALNKVKAKIPGLRQTLEPSIDVLGREVKTNNSVGNVMFNPANTAFARTTEGAEEMYRVYQATGDKAAIAQVAPYYFNVGSDKVVLTPAQRTQYQKTIGKIASDGVENLLQIKSYKDLPDTEKAEVLKELYSYGNAIAKAEASTRYLLPKDMAKIKDSGMKPEEYILLKRISNLGGDKKDEKLEALITSGYSAKESKNFLSDYKGYKFN